MTDPISQNTNPNPDLSCADLLSPLKPIKSPIQNPAISYAADLLTHYCFDLEAEDLQQWLSFWVQHYPASWISSAVIEALYLGRYKAVSVEQVLVTWKRRGKASHHYTHEFERLICKRFPQGFKQPQCKKPHSFRIRSSPALAALRDISTQVPNLLPEPEVSPSVDALPLYCSQTVAPSAAEKRLSRPASKGSAASAQDLYPNQSSIMQFVPATVTSGFYARLKALVDEANRAKTHSSCSVKT